MAPAGSGKNLAFSARLARPAPLELPGAAAELLPGSNRHAPPPISRPQARSARQGLPASAGSLSASMMTQVSCNGRLPAKLVRDLKAGDVILRASRGKARVVAVTHGIKSAWLRIAGSEVPFETVIWKRLDSKAASEC